MLFPSERGQPRRRKRPVVSTVFSLSIGLISSLSLAGMAMAQNAPVNAAGVDRRLVVPVAEGRGPHEKVVRFEVAPDADQFAYPQPEIDALAGALEGENRAARDAAQIDLAVKAFGLSQGGFAAIGTLAEHAAYAKSFARVNTALNNIGLVFALAQAGRDVANGNTQAAVIGTTKALVNYAVGRFGSSALQIAGVASFVVDVTLSEWQAGLTEIAEDVQFCRYKAYYDAHGMSVHDWQVKALDLYKRAEKTRDPKAFDTWLDAAVNEYVHRAFTSDEIELYSECGGSSFGDTAYIQGRLEEEHKGFLNEMLVEKVLPEIADYAWKRTLQAQVAAANRDLRPELNRTFDLEVTAYDFEEGARVVMPLPNGSEWGGRLRDNGTFRAQLTYYALMKAGFPDEIRLESGGESDTVDLVVSEGRLSAVFGVPATPYVARYSLQESAQSCEVKRMHEGEDPTFETQDRPASGLDHLDMAVVVRPSGTPLPIQGDFNGTSWVLASPGRYENGVTLYGEPYLDSITSLENCAFDMFSQGSLAEGDCTIERHERKAVSTHTVIERTCISTAQISMEGIFATMGEGMQYYALDTPEGRATISALRAAMGQYMPGFDASSLHITTPDNQ